MKHKKGQVELHWIVGMFFIIGGILYILQQATFGSVLIGLGVFIEVLYKWLVKIV
jgi:hypothetical protein